MTRKIEEDHLPNIQGCNAERFDDLTFVTTVGNRPVEEVSHTPPSKKPKQVDDSNDQLKDEIADTIAGYHYVDPA